MKTMTQANPVQISTTIDGIKKSNSFIVKSLKAGFRGFTITIMLLFFINLLSYVIGSDESYGMDIMDLSLAGLGFALQMTSTFLKNFAK